MSIAYNYILEQFKIGLLPTPATTVSEWADKNRFLDSKASSEPGKYLTSRTPYLKEIMDSLSSNDPTQIIVCKKGSQIGATELATNWMGYVIDINPGPFLAVYPTENLTKRVSKFRFTPMVKSCKSLSSKVAEKKRSDLTNSIYEKEFIGGILYYTWSNSPSGLKSVPVKYIFFDEIDEYPQEVADQGDVIAVALARTRTFPDSKIFLASTPTTKGLSLIEDAFEKSDKRYFEIPCPGCNKYQALKFEYLKCERDKENNKVIEESVHYLCKYCSYKIKNYEKKDFLQKGIWKATAKSEIKGYHVSSLYSPVGWYSWEDILKDYFKAYKNPLLLKVFVNTVLGEEWEEKGESPDHEKLYERRELYETTPEGELIVPNNVLFITAGVDVQKDRFEIEVRGWGRGKRSWSLEYIVISANTDQIENYSKLRSVLDKQYLHESGVRLPITTMAIDTGYNTQVVYNFCRKFPSTRVMAVKGVSGQSTILSIPKAVDVYHDGRRSRRSLKLWSVGVSVIKQELYGWLKLEIESGEIPEGYIFFPYYEEEYFRQLTSEYLVKIRDKRGRTSYQWKKHRERNEGLDVAVYNRAAAALVGIDRFLEKDWEFLENQFIKQATSKTKSRKRKMINKGIQ